jgi:hypothetical protein
LIGGGADEIDFLDNCYHDPQRCQRGQLLSEELDWSSMLKERLRQALTDQARTGNPTTYKELADRLGLDPPHTIHRVGEALETLMEDDLAARRPMLASLCVSKMRSGIPDQGFFLKAQVLGVFSGDPTGPEASALHPDELQRVLSFYGSQHPHLVLGASDRRQSRSEVSSRSGRRS